MTKQVEAVVRRWCEFDTNSITTAKQNKLVFRGYFRDAQNLL